MAFEDPSHPEQRRIAARAGLEVVPVAVDDTGIRVDELARAEVDAVALTPAHQHPTGAVLSGERRTALLAWLRATGAVAIEDDYDAEYRYDRAAVGALQGLAPDQVVYAGSVSKTLAPGLRLGWLVVPPRFLDTVTDEKDLADCGTARIDQHALADFLTRGELDRHLRRMRTRYRRRRDFLATTLAEVLPQATLQGIEAGLHATVRLPGHYDEQAVLDQALLWHIGLTTMRDLVGRTRFGIADAPARLRPGPGASHPRRHPRAGPRRPGSCRRREPEAGRGEGLRHLARCW